VLAFLAAAALAVLLSVQPASGRIGSSCDHAANTATFTYADSGFEGRVSASYNEDFMGKDLAAGSYKGETNGFSTFGASVCDDPDPFASIHIELGNHDEEARLDGRKPNFASQAPDPIPAFVTATIDGNRGADVLRGHSGPDGMTGGKGADLIRVKGGGSDEINCGGGHDKAVVDNNDLLVNCEDVVSG